MELDRFKCKENFVYQGHYSPVFKKGEWYMRDRKFTINENWYHSILLENSTIHYTLTDATFNTHFYSVDEVREIEIDKILDI
jgi:hypothetical protein